MSCCDAEDDQIGTPQGHLAAVTSQDKHLNSLHLISLIPNHNNRIRVVLKFINAMWI